MDGISNIFGGFLTAVRYPHRAVSAVASPFPSRDQPELLKNLTLDIDRLTTKLFDKNDDEVVDERDVMVQFMLMMRQGEEHVGKETEKATKDRQQTLRARYEQEVAQRTVVETSPQGEAADEGEREEAALTKRDAHERSGNDARLDLTA